MRFLATAVVAASLAAVLPGTGAGQISQRDAQYWLPADYNHAFYNTHRSAARSFYAAHFAHFGVYEVAMTPGPDLNQRMARLETDIRGIVAQPPRFEPPIDVVAAAWSKIAHGTAMAMDWTHHLHEQLYDILTDASVRDKRAAGERAIAYYLTNARAAFSTRGYGHAFMLGGGSWAGTFAARFPGINGILWAYHWHHASVYEALMEESVEEQRRALDRVLRVFRDSVLASPPTYMPLTAQYAPRFSEMFPAAAHIFDNLHMMHDVVNDIMVDPHVPVDAKGGEIGRLLSQMLYRNQPWVIPPPVPAGAHGAMAMPAMMTVPTQLADGRWLPQGHPRARVAGMAGDHEHTKPTRREEGGTR